MLVVETIAKIHHAYFVQGKPIKAICRELGLSQKIVRKVMRSEATEFQYRRAAQPLPQVGPASIIPRTMSNSNKKSEPILAFKTAQDLEAYLAGEPRASKGFWLKLSKTGAVETTINKGDAIEVALCWGWIDGQLDKFDDQYFLVRMTPRRPGSRWSAKNREAADRLLAQGRLQPPRSC